MAKPHLNEDEIKYIGLTIDRHLYNNGKPFLPIVEDALSILGGRITTE